MADNIKYGVYQYSSGQLHLAGTKTNSRGYFSSVREALDYTKKLANRKILKNPNKTYRDVTPDLQYVICEYTAPYKSRIICIVSQEDVMQEKFSYEMQ